MVKIKITPFIDGPAGRSLQLWLSEDKAVALNVVYTKAPHDKNKWSGCQYWGYDTGVASVRAVQAWLKGTVLSLSFWRGDHQIDTGRCEAFARDVL